jgi:hypothetical protein
VAKGLTKNEAPFVLRTDAQSSPCALNPAPWSASHRCREKRSKEMPLASLGAARFWGKSLAAIEKGVE